MGRSRGAAIDTARPSPDMRRAMLRRILPLLVLLTAAPPALAQGEPFRVVNAAAAPATGLYVVRSGGEGWGANLLNRGPLAAGAQFGLRAPVGAGCVFDIRLVLQSGEEAVRRDVDVCQERLVSMAAEFRTPPPRAATLPRVGDGAPTPR